MGIKTEMGQTLYNRNHKNEFVKNAAEKTWNSPIDIIGAMKAIQEKKIDEHHVYELMLMNEELYEYNQKIIRLMKEECGRRD